MMDQRRAGLEQWLRAELGFTIDELQPASNDASFRRYFRFSHEATSLIAVDAPPETENNPAYIAVATSLGEIGLNVPQVLEVDLQRGYLLVSDLGNNTYLRQLTVDNVDRLYGDALAALLTLQACAPVDGGDGHDDRLPRYDRPMLLRETGLFSEWYLQAHRGLTAPSFLPGVEALLADSALQQPQVFVHRDYHSRNLMLAERNNPGILDFQDAVIGPVTYDLVSLLRDCYIAWPAQRVRDWAVGYHELAVQKGILREDDEARFLQWFDLMGMQRHLKAIGIFARLKHRDGKDGYLADIPRTLGYVIEVAARYPMLADFGRWLQRDVMPGVQPG